MDQVVIKYAKDKPIIFSSFHPDAAVLMKKLQTFYPVRSIHIYMYRADGFKNSELIF